MSKTTTQLQKEDEHTEKFKKYLSKIGCCDIKNWGPGHENKKLNKDADITIKVEDSTLFNSCFKNHFWKNGDELTVSLKTLGGNFTSANLGTGIQSYLYQIMSLDQEEKLAMDELKTGVKIIKKKLGMYSRWEEVGNEKKLLIKDLLMLFNYHLFQYRPHQEALYNFMNSRQSDLKYVGDKLFVPEQIKIPNKIDVYEKGDDSLIVGHWKLRFKSSGGWVKNSWKINVEFNQ